jgi:BirA family biotin operon repressor/biotin-[acetyl-CoA-carboxylase] ligase
MTPACLSAELVRRHLATSRFGSEVRVVAETPSTIDLAWQWLRCGGPDGGVVIAERQTAGRGRLGRAWASPRGGLWMSIACRPRMPAVAAGRLGAAVAIAAAEAVAEAASARTGVRWPNDVILAGRKVGGVLAETEVQGGETTAAVLSLGLNVNLQADQLPEEVRDTATSILCETGKSTPIEVMAGRVLDRLAAWWPEALAGGDALARRWAELDVLAGRQVMIRAGGTTLTGVGEGIDRNACLLLVTSEGRRNLTTGEVEMLRGNA